MEYKTMTDADRKRLARCPWCPDNEGLYYDDNNHDSEFISCGRCGAEGPSGDTLELAIERWNSWKKGNVNGK